MARMVATAWKSCIQAGSDAASAMSQACTPVAARNDTGIQTSAARMTSKAPPGESLRQVRNTQAMPSSNK